MDATTVRHKQITCPHCQREQLVHLLAAPDKPSFDEKDVGYYTENYPAKLTNFFAVCNPEERLRLYVLFLLGLP